MGLACRVSRGCEGSGCFKTSSVGIGEGVELAGAWVMTIGSKGAERSGVLLL